MFDPSSFRELVSGRRRGPAAALLRAALRLAETPYACAVRWRNRRYDRSPQAVCRVGVPVVSVGNLTLGGTGKTPMVRWVARWFRRRGVRAAVLSRGYGAAAGARADEALELEHDLPDVPHLENPNRVDAARVAIDELGCQLIVLDDGFQHRRIGRDVDLVLLDASEPFGYGHVFPRGFLREPVDGLRRAHAVVLARADMVQAEDRQAIRRRVERYAKDAVWAEVIHAPQALVDGEGKREPLEGLRGRPVAAFCGIGNPRGFLHTLERSGLVVAGFREFPDHHPYGRSDMDQLQHWVDQLDVAAVLCTHKDLVKIRVVQLGRHPLRALAIQMEFLSGQEDLEALLDHLLARVPPGSAGN